MEVVRLMAQSITRELMRARDNPTKATEINIMPVLVTPLRCAARATKLHPFPGGSGVGFFTGMHSFP
jgi:hypothetical protein